jgi:hypothetical protein
MESQSILQLYDQEMRLDPASDRATVYRQPGLTFVILKRPIVRTGWVLFTQLHPAEVDQVIQSTVDFYRPLGGELEWKVYPHDSPPDLKEYLQAHGFVPEELESLLVLDLENTQPSFWEPSATRVDQLTSPDQLSYITRIESEVYGEPFTFLEPMLAGEMQALPDQISIYTAYAGDEPASTAWIRFNPGRQFAELYGGATLPSQRSQGLYSSLVKARAREARSRGVRFLLVDPTAMSRPILEKLGFIFLTSSQPFVMKFNQSAAR